jgi:hypothetical protein
LTFPPNFIVDAEKRDYGRLYKIAGFSNDVIMEISGGNDLFVNSCVDAARKLRFVPAQKNGVNADSVKIIDYNMRGLRISTTIPGQVLTPSGLPF